MIGEIEPNVIVDTFKEMLLNKLNALETASIILFVLLSLAIIIMSIALIHKNKEPKQQQEPTKPKDLKPINWNHF